MGIEIDLLKNYPRTKRLVKERGLIKSSDDQQIARKFNKEFFDGDRKHGYGGYYYNPRFWKPVIPTLQEHFSLNFQSKVLDIGCGKGFMLHDMTELIPRINVRGIDISKYAIDNTMEDIKQFTSVANAIELPFKDNSFDVVFSITTLHNLEKNDLKKALMEIDRVGKGKSFITVDAYRNNEEKELMHAWNLTAKTMMHVDEWKLFFKEVGYSGDYYWFIP